MMERLFSKFPASFGFSVSHTTRSPRSGEVRETCQCSSQISNVSPKTEGKSYYFAEREAFEGMKARGEFIETAEFSGNCYGTSIKAVENVKASGRICVLDLEVNGVKAIKTKDLNAKYM